MRLIGQSLYRLQRVGGTHDADCHNRHNALLSDAQSKDERIRAYGVRVDDGDSMFIDEATSAE